jgi:hypothetical protein
MLATVDSSATLKRHARNANDFYVEPEWAVKGLLDVQKFSGVTWDPACGSGTIPRVFDGAGLDAHGTDIVDRGHLPAVILHDFLAKPQPWHVTPDNIVCNPPFDLAEPFLGMALTVAKHKVAFLLRLSWCEGVKRRWGWEETPLAAIHPFAARVSMPPGGKGIKAKGGAVAFAWYVWAKDHVGPPIVRRIERRASA